jgi:threonylcarbamoyladenosine tRNA methylthiotransferase MtaB
MVWTVLVLEEKMKKKVALHNLGCKVNSYELEAMQQLLEQAGYEIVPFEPGADVYVINTCTVTNIADRKSRQMLHKAKKMNPDAVVVAVKNLK